MKMFLQIVEEALLKAVADQSVSIAIDTSDLQFYSGSVHSGSCGTCLDHGVSVIGKIIVCCYSRLI